jgi:hypothetical protein
MKKLVVDMETKSSWKEMKFSLIEAASLSIFLAMKLATHLFLE